MSVYQPTATAEIRTRSNYPSTQTADVLNCGLFSGRTERGYLQFPALSTIYGETIDEAYLVLNQASGGYVSTLTFTISLMQDTYSWSNISYNNQPTAASTKTGRTLYGTSAGDRWYDVTTIVQAVADNSYTYTIWELLRTSSTTTDGKIFSTSYGNHKLVIVYSAGTPTYSVTFVGVPVGGSCKVVDNDTVTSVTANRGASDTVEVDTSTLDYPYDSVSVWSEPAGAGELYDYLDTNDHSELGPDDVYTLTGFGGEVIRFKVYDPEEEEGVTMDLGVAGLSLVGDFDANNFTVVDTWTPTITCSGSMTHSGDTIYTALYNVVGDWVHIQGRFGTTLGTSASNNVIIDLPIDARDATELSYINGFCKTSQDSYLSEVVGDGTYTDRVYLQRPGAANYSLSWTTWKFNLRYRWQ